MFLDSHSIMRLYLDTWGVDVFVSVNACPASSKVGSFEVCCG